jgi:hypothetical protein
MEIWDKLLKPEVVWVFIPLAPIVFWGITSVIRALRGEPEDFGEWTKKLRDLEARVEELERARHGPRPVATDPYVPSPERSV